MHRIILDTDIGDDVDDALTMGLICRCPELQLLGVTTVFANVAARARQARTLLKVAGERFEFIPVLAGCGASMASRPMHNIKQYLQNALPNQDSICLPEAELPPQDKRHGVDFLVNTIMAGDGDIIPITIGAMTNLAMAMIKEWRIVAKIPRIVVMAGEFKRSMAEYNILCDPEAAHIVFSSGIPVDVITWDTGDTVQFGPEHVRRLADASSLLAQRLWAATVAWRKA